MRQTNDPDARWVWFYPSSNSVSYPEHDCMVGSIDRVTGAVWYSYVVMPSSIFAPMGFVAFVLDELESRRMIDGMSHYYHGIIHHGSP